MEDMDMSMPMTTAAPAAKRIKMWMYFHTEIADLVLFKEWRILTVKDMIWTCLGVIAFGIILEGIKFFRFYVEQKFKASLKVQQDAILNPSKTMAYKKKLFSGHHLIQTILFGIQLVFSYVLMLVFMTFSLWLCIAVCVGLTIGYYFFGSREIVSTPVSLIKPIQENSAERIEDCCS
uniref:Copper transport protein n=1 Tax=Panagrellus redivivus TaxID=6233 RepID=A0A7E4V906_PANRE